MGPRAQILLRVLRGTDDDLGRREMTFRAQRLRGESVPQLLIAYYRIPAASRALERSR